MKIFRFKPGEANIVSKLTLLRVSLNFNNSLKMCRKSKFTIIVDVQQCDKNVTKLL